MSERVHIAYVTDMGLFDPTLLSLWSALQATPGPVTVHFAGFDLTTEARARLERTVAAFEGKRLEWLELDGGPLARSDAAAAHISIHTMARMFLPGAIKGRVIYIDGDTLVLRDLRPLFTCDLRDRALAAVPDFVVSKWAARGAGNDRRIADMTALMGDAPWQGYFNAGILLMDCAAIRAMDGLQAAMEDIAPAARYEMADQDRLNELFAGRYLMLDPKWNASWGRVRRHRAMLRTTLPSLRLAQSGPAILHFHGPHKPWKPLRLSTLTRGVRATLRYRLAQRRFAATGL